MAIISSIDKLISVANLTNLLIKQNANGRGDGEEYSLSNLRLGQLKGVFNYLTQLTTEEQLSPKFNQETEMAQGDI